MKRWNGWGENGIHLPLLAHAAALLRSLVGDGQPRPDAALADVVRGVPPSRLPAHPLVDTSGEVRARHARGQSLPDWIALRSGRVGVFPDGVAFPVSTAEVRALLRWAAEVGTHVIPYGGGTSVAGHVNPAAGNVPVLTLSLARLSSLVSWDETSRLATFGAGIGGPALEAHLRARGATLGHFPQSFEYSTLGGWVVTRSSGQQSLGYGRIERLFAGGRLESPSGTLELPCFPASSAGIDLREIVLGSEGRLGVLTEATVRASALPETTWRRGVFFPDFETAAAAARAMAQARVPLTMMRVSTDVETETLLGSSPHQGLVNALSTYLGWRGLGPGRSLMLLIAAGTKAAVRGGAAAALEIARAHGGVDTGASVADGWYRNRFRGAYLRNALWDGGWAVDTLETAASWIRLPALRNAVEGSLRGGLTADGERVHVFSHMSHFYPDGASLYTTYLFRLGPDPGATLARWTKLKTAASDAIHRSGGTISHQHGVGVDHAPWMAAEKGPFAMARLGRIVSDFDPKGLMNPGKMMEVRPC